MDHYAIIGNPIEHSRSPKIHRLFGEQLQHVLAYEKIEATEKTFQEKVEEFFTKGGKGINITVPFKRLAFSISDKLGVCASSCGAVNTLSFSEDGRVYGESTDGNGLVEDLKNNNIAINNKSILIVGAGGTAQSIIPSLLANNVGQISVTNRTPNNAFKLKEQYLHLAEIVCLDGASINRNFDLVINTTSAHLSGELPEIEPIAVEKATSYDVNYSYGETLFQSWATNHGATKSLQGWGMLVEQAAESFYIWRGVRPKTRVVIDRLSSEPEN